MTIAVEWGLVRMNFDFAGMKAIDELSESERGYISERISLGQADAFPRRGARSSPESFEIRGGRPGAGLRLFRKRGRPTSDRKAGHSGW